MVSPYLWLIQVGPFGMSYLWFCLGKGVNSIPHEVRTWEATCRGIYKNIARRERVMGTNIIITKDMKYLGVSFELLQG